MGDDKNTSKRGDTKEYVVVFDRLDVHTGEFAPAGPGAPALMLTEAKYRSQKVNLTKEEAERHLAVGAVIAADDPRAKHVSPNPERTQGVVREATASLGTSVQQIDVAPVTTDRDGGAKRASGKGSLGTEAELNRMKAPELKKLAAEHGVEVERGDNKKTLARKLSKVNVDDATDAVDTQTDNPGQGKDQSPPEGGAAADAALEDDDHPASKDDDDS